MCTGTGGGGSGAGGDALLWQDGASVVAMKRALEAQGAALSGDGKSSSKYSRGGDGSKQELVLDSKPLNDLKEIALRAERKKNSDAGGAGAGAGSKDPAPAPSPAGE